MAKAEYKFLILISILTHHQIESILLVVPEDVPMGFAAIYGFTPRLLKGNDHRFGFGFRFGNHADFQVLYEFGPQIYTAPMTPPRVRSAPYRPISRRRPFFETLLKFGLVKDTSYVNTVFEESDNGCPYEPR